MRATSAQRYPALPACSNRSEEVIKAQFAKVFVQDDWRLFKRMAEFHFERAVFLKISDVTRMAKRWRLLARNSDKRLRIGLKPGVSRDVTAATLD